MVKHATGPGISKTDHVQVKVHPGATTDNIDYIKPTFCQKPDTFIIHSGANYLTKDVNTMVWLGRIVVTKKEIETKEKIKLILSGIFSRGDINKEEDIIGTNNRLDKY